MQWSFIAGMNTTIWSLIGGLRYFFEYPRQPHILGIGKESAPKLGTAVCMAAHNEAEVIGPTISSLLKIVPAHNIYIANDNSTDETAAIARKMGCHVLDLSSNVGKPTALEKLIDRYKLCDRYSYVIFADADTIFDTAYLQNAMSIFQSDEQTVAIAGFARSDWQPRESFSIKDWIISYRARQYLIFQWLLTYGQSWKWTNVVSVVPGFASIYRTETLKQLHIFTPGVTIEDFSLAFQIHKFKLGKIAHNPKVFATTQDPDNLIDYTQQMDRWNLGLWQTIRHWKIWPSLFWLNLSVFLAELICFTFFIAFAPVILILLLGNDPSSPYISLILFVYITTFLVDYILTLMVAIAERRPRLIIYGLGYIFLRVIDAITFLESIPPGFYTKSSGQWLSPKRRSVANLQLVGKLGHSVD